MEKPTNKSETKILTCFRPAGITNPYVKNVRSALYEAGYETADLKEILKNPKKFASCRIWNFNFYENLSSKKEYYAKVAVLKMLKVFHKKIIFTMHNKQAHQGAMRPLSIKMMKHLCKEADAIVGLCPDTKDAIMNIAPGCEDKLVVIPHPAYIEKIPEGNLYEELAKTDRRSEIREQYGIGEDDILLLSVGFVMPYKNFEMVIRAVKECGDRHVHLLIAGKPKPVEYGEELKALAGDDKNIHLHLQYLSEEELVALYQASDLSVLPYHTESSLNSGAVYMSFSMKRTVMCPEIGSITMIEDPSFTYHYIYESKEEHEEKLKEQLKKLIQDHKEDPNDIHKKGEQAFSYVMKNHGRERIVTDYKALYDRLLSD